MLLLSVEEHYQRELARNKLNSIHVQKEADKYSNLHISPYKLPSEHASLPDEDGLWSSVQENNFYNFDQMLPSSSSEHENVADTIDEIRPMKTTTQKPATEAPQQTEKVTIQPVKKPVIAAPNHTGECGNGYKLSAINHCQAYVPVTWTVMKMWA